MFYCRKCARLLDEDLKKCPYCGNEEESENTTSSSTDLDSQLDELNKIIEENQNKEKISELPDTPDPPMIMQPDIPEPQLQKPYTPPPKPQQTVVETNEISSGMRVLFILMSIFIAPAGIIVGAIYMGKDSKEFKSLGKTMLIISIVSIVLLVICCCVFYGALFSLGMSANEGWY